MDTQTRPIDPLVTSDDPNGAHVLVLMAVWNGAAHLQEQLDSLVAQSHENWTLWVSDDNSTDNSRALLEDFASKHPNTRIFEGPGRGGSENFLSLLRAVPSELAQASFIAFCDQDDVWMPDRLRHGLKALVNAIGAKPALFCSGSLITDNKLQRPVPSPARPRPPGFQNALVQNIASGNTTLLNPTASQLICDASRIVPGVVVHDWWVYQLISGVGGQVIHDDTPLIYYRQHPDNQIGANNTRRAQLKRVKMLLDGHFRDWNEINIAALRATHDLLTPENQITLRQFAEMRKAGLFDRIKRFARLGLYRQTLAETLVLWMSVLLRRV